MADEPGVRVPEASDPPSGVDERGEWKPSFPGQRPPFGQGHQLSVRHGAHALLALQPRAAEIADVLREAAPALPPGSEIALESAAMIGARLEVAMRALTEAADPRTLNDLDQRAQGWARQWAAWLDRLGLTPLAAARLGLDLTRARGEALRAHLGENYAADEGGS